MCRGMSEGTATAVPSRPTTYTRESRSHEGSAWPLQRGVHALHTVFLFRLSPKVDMNRFQACFLSWTQAVAQLTQGTLISLDGKTLRASFDRATASSPLHMLSAWCSDHGGLVVGQLKTDSKSNEITAIPELLHLLAIKGCIVTIDAMGCQTAIANQIRDQGGDYLLALKGNHKKAYKAIKQYFHQHIEHQLAWRTAENFFDAFDDAHGRTVRRRVWIITDLVALPELAKWPDLHAVIVVETIRAAYPGALITSDYRVYISSLIRSATALRHDDSPALGY